MENNQSPSQSDYHKFLEESAEDLYENATCGYLSCTMDGTIVKINRTLLGWLGYKVEAIVHVKTFQALLSIGGKIFYETHFGPLLHMQGSINEISLELLRHDRSLLPVLVNAVQLKNEEGEPVLNRITIVNITDRRKYEEELLLSKRKAEQISQDLITANEELTSSTEQLSISNEELATANQHLSSLNSELDNFIYAASHDLRAPVNNIEGLIRVLVRNLPAAVLEYKEVSEVLDLMNRSILRFKKTISDLTEVIKVKQEILQQPEKIALQDTIRESLLDIAFLIEETETVIELDIADCLDLSFSKKNFKSIVYNLVSNAIKYCSPDRKPVVRIRCEQADSYIILSVQDNGLGLDEQSLDKIFLMFKRLHNHVEGTGIGLYIVKKIIDNAKGKIQVESKLGEGSTFRIYFKK